MKKILGFFVIAALFAIGCTPKDEYQPAERESGAQYFFPVGTETSYKINETVESLEFIIKRVEKDAASSVIIAVTDTSKTFFESGFGDIEANFEAGSDEASISIPVDISKYEFGDKLGLDIEITEETTFYAPASIHVVVEYPEPWTSLGIGVITENAIFAKSGPVEILQNDLKPNVFRIVKPFVSLYEALGGKEEDMYEKADYLELTVGQPGDVVHGITLTKSGLVFWDEICTSLYNSTYSAYVYLDHPYEFSSLQSEDEWIYNRVLGYQEEDDSLPTQIQLAPMYYMYGVGAFNYHSYDGVCLITFPGVVIADYNTEVEYTGLFNKKDGTIEAMADVTLGEDVDYVKVALVPGDADDAQDSAYDDALDLILSEEESESVVVLKMSDTKTVNVLLEEEEEEVTLHIGEVRLPMPEEIAEYYSFVVVPFNADGEPQEVAASYDVFQFKDFGIALTLAEPETDGDGNGHITATIEFGADTEGAFAVLAPGKDQAALRAALNLILGGDDSVVFIDKPGDVTFDIEGEGDFLVMVASYAEGDLWNLDYDFFEYFAVDPWETMGYILYTDDFICPLFGMPRESYWVPFQKNTTSEGLYRLMNPYHEAFPYNDPAYWEDAVVWDNTKDHHIVIDATDPDIVVIPQQNTGTNWGYGEMYILSLGQYYLNQGYTPAQIIAGAGDVFGKLADGKITFEAGTLMVGDDDDIYIPRGMQGLVLDLNDIRETAPASAPMKYMPKKSARVNANASVKSIGAPQFPRTLKRAAVEVSKGKANSRGMKPVPMSK